MAQIMRILSPQTMTVNRDQNNVHLGGGTSMKTRIARVALRLTMLMSIAIVIPQISHAQGESAVPFLLISPNSRSSGIGEAGTGTVDDASAIFWNPAGLAFLKGHE